MVRDRKAAALEAELDRRRIEAEVQRATAQRLQELNRTLLAAQMMQSALLVQLRRQQEGLERQARLEREQLQAAEKLAQIRQDFVAGASHELRTPLTAILGYAELLDTRWSGMAESQRSEVIRKIVTSAHRQLRLVEDLLLATRAEADRLTLHPTTSSLADLARRAAEEVRTSYPAQPIDLRGPSQLVVRGDADRIVQILVNLIDNAAKYSPEGSPISVRWGCRGGMGVARVRDRGPGIPAAGRASLFARFGRVPGVRPRPGHPSTGLGLYLSRLLAEAMRGSLELERTGPAGSTFRLALPVADAGGCEA